MLFTDRLIRAQPVLSYLKKFRPSRETAIIGYRASPLRSRLLFIMDNVAFGGRQLGG